ncbi:MULTISPECIES: MOSC domain-containing protein [Actinoalloteichus]|uniref:MOSC domain-containing protein YiiM n=1 Tax=Actinoalloteichus caeruleus DSM 43889 TaxID=1120930 RepID=A0ABT1JNY2_ACTCY|nr:MOSC domain-containing protein [Actinoalloteichus caeruleus]MCP2334230.1 MOSC domain-containing protein YiiM [Actinoalloteichus caeruleus DSM 43889]
MGEVVSVNVAVVRHGAWTGRMGSSGIDKRAVPGPVSLTGAGVAGDTIVDTASHGGWYRAAYAFELAELRYWSQELGRELVPGNAGENLTLDGMDSSDAVIGERWRIGSAVLRVTGPRTPCRVFAGFWEAERFVRRFTERGRTGAYLAVDEEGLVSAGDRVEVLSRPAHGVTVAEVFAVKQRRRPDLVDHVCQALDDLPQEWADKVRAARAAATTSMA